MRAGQVATAASNRIGNSSNSNPSKPSRSPIHSTLARTKNTAGARRVFGEKQPSTNNTSERVLFARPRAKDDDDDDEMDDLNAPSDDEDAMSEDWEEGKTLVDNLKNFGLECVFVSVPRRVLHHVATRFRDLRSPLATATMR